MFGVNGAKGFWVPGKFVCCESCTVWPVCGVESVWYERKVVKGGWCKICLV